MNARSDARSVEGRLEELRGLVSIGLSDLVKETSPGLLFEPVRYVLSGKGKYIRPMLLLGTTDGYGISMSSALPAALAVEVFHNFTLVHDDIMDRSPTRRNRETVHVKWGVPSGILTGDYLLALSYSLLSKLPDDKQPASMRRFNEMVAKLCVGQALDTEFETRSEVSLAEYREMVSCKTGALIELSLGLGGLIGGAPESDLLQLRRLGLSLGLAFQIQDDLLDLTADQAKWGKPVGGDLILGKKSYLSILALQREAETGDNWFTTKLKKGGLAPEQIPAAHDRLIKMGVIEETKQEVLALYENATTALDELEDARSFAIVRGAIAELRERVH